MNFKSDNAAGISPEILDAIVQANIDYADPYGADSYSQKLQQKISEVFETETHVFMVSTGTVANSLAIAALTPSYGSVLCHPEAHIYTSECGAPSFFSSGAKTVLVDGVDGKMNPKGLGQTLTAIQAHLPRENKPNVLSLTQGTEMGTVYTLEELQSLIQVAKTYGMNVHMDGARFTNALVYLGCTPAEMTWKAGVDVLCLGATKNGAMAAEAILFFNLKLAKDFEYRHKQAGQVFSKARYFSAQMNAFFENRLWTKNAWHANGMAQVLIKNLLDTGLVTVFHPVEMNEVFVQMSNHLSTYLLNMGVKFYTWNDCKCRFVTSFTTTDQEIDDLVRLIHLYKKLENFDERKEDFSRTQAGTTLWS